MNSTNQHYVPRFYLRNFMSNKVKRKENQRVWALDHDGDIKQPKIDEICAIPDYNTEEQDERLTLLENIRFSPALKSLKSEYPPTNETNTGNLILFVSYLLAGNPKTRHVFTKSLEYHICESAGIERIGGSSNDITDDITGLFEFTERTASLFFQAVSQWIINFVEIKSHESFITCDNPVYINNRGQGVLFRVDFSNINYEYITYSDRENRVVGDTLRAISDITAVHFDYPTVICLPLSPKRAMLLHSSIQSIEELNTFMEVKDITLAQCLNFPIYGQSILYAFSHEKSILSSMSGLIRWAS